MEKSSEKKVIKSYVNENLYEELKEVAQLLDISISKCISQCLVQGLEVMVAEALNRKPKVVSRAMKKYFDENNIEV